MEIKIIFTAWRETINSFQKGYYGARGILLLHHSLTAAKETSTFGFLKSAHGMRRFQNKSTAACIGKHDF